MGFGPRVLLRGAGNLLNETGGWGGGPRGDLGWVRVRGAIGRVGVGIEDGVTGVGMEWDGVVAEGLVTEA